MNSPPHRDQPLSLALDLQHHPAHIAAADTGDPIEPDLARSFQDDLCFAALTEHMHMRRAVVVRKNHEPEAMGAVDRHHETNPSMLGFQAQTRSSTRNDARAANAFLPLRGGMRWGSPSASAIGRGSIIKSVSAKSTSSAHSRASGNPASPTRLQ